ncbi:MAG: alpha-amylase [Chloroflexia bacterium]|nr:alpha-amylase [Chloroflexia bacterium]
MRQRAHRTVAFSACTLLLLMGLVGVAPVASQRPATPTADITATSPWWENAVCYEVFVRSFADSDGDGIGDLRGLIERLDYINDGDPRGGDDLGATCVWLMPIFTATSYHGYDVEDYYAIDPAYGSNEDFSQLITQAHERGIRVILDLVLNHTSREHPWFQDALVNPDSPYRDWYIWADEHPGYNGPWGAPAWHQSPSADEFYYGIFWEGMPDLNYRNPVVTAEAEKISAFWLNEMGADGFRLDAIKHLIEDGRIQENTLETHDWLREYRAYLAQVKPDALTIGEIFGASASTLETYYPDQLDAYFAFDVGQGLLNAASFGAGQQLVAAVEAAEEELPDQRWAPFLTNHDQARTMSALDGNIEEAKMAATALLTVPGLPFIYYGEEIGMSGTKPDERIRTPMQWATGEDGGFTSGTPWEPFQEDRDTVNVASQSDDPASLLNHYRQLVRLHVTHPALSRGDFQPLATAGRSPAAFLRQAPEETLFVLLNTGKDPIENLVITAVATGLEPGDYTLTPLLGDEPAANLTVDVNGAIAAFTPLPTLDPRTGYIWLLTPAA